MAKKAKKKSATRTGTTSKKTRKVIAVRSVKAKKPAKKTTARKATRRSAADVAKLRKSVIAAFKAKKPAEAIAKDLGISKAYVYVLRNKA